MSRAVKYAQSLLVRYWDKTIPIQPEKLIHKIQDLDLCYEDLNEQISGKINYDFERSKYVITINKNHHANRQRFTMAHELGHYILNHGTKEDTLYRNGETDPDEIEANVFAAEILMPTGVIRHLIYEQGITKVSELAEKLWVSESAMIYRLKNLGIIS